ncbi:phospholipase A1-IIgamma [Citrus sinensis]|uniref:Phospholipase A1-IIgamma n=1 Tax=Citrus sinensis TaxID=2711 RepID=A0ACB8JP60_CITSI|nr:phospholipase A1-IIgamma [Citrus sinensis]
MGGTSIADNWKELSGNNNWDGLLNPLNINLRRYIIHYGERVQAIYDSFNGEITSKMYGFPRYAPENFFSNVALQNGNPYKYIVTDYLYARSDTDFLEWLLPDQSAWIGYVAVATDEGKAVLGRRDILISWRGTQSAAEWFKDIEFSLTAASDIFEDTYGPTPEVHSGFYSLYVKSDSASTYNKSSAKDQVRSAVRTLVDKYKEEEMSITVIGHSLGSALATLNAADLVANGYNKPTGSDAASGCMVTAIVFASPRVGNSAFKTLFEDLNHLHLLRVTNKHDIVPDLPPSYLPPIAIGYVHVGQELKIDTTKSTYVKKPSVASVLHNLENYLHGIAGTPKGDDDDDDFELAIDRDIALVNKGLDLLEVKYGVPHLEFTDLKHTMCLASRKNKSMVQLDNGFWKLEDYVPDPPSTIPTTTS